MWASFQIQSIINCIFSELSREFFKWYISLLYCISFFYSLYRFVSFYISFRRDDEQTFISLCDFSKSTKIVIWIFLWSSSTRNELSVCFVIVVIFFHPTHFSRFALFCVFPTAKRNLKYMVFCVWFISFFLLLFLQNIQLNEFHYFNPRK